MTEIICPHNIVIQNFCNDVIFWRIIWGITIWRAVNWKIHFHMMVWNVFKHIWCILYEFAQSTSSVINSWIFLSNIKPFSDLSGWPMGPKEDSFYRRVFIYTCEFPLMSKQISTKKRCLSCLTAQMSDTGTRGKKDKI